MSLYLYSEKVAILSILFLVFADPISSFFGVKYGKTKLMENKSFEGSLAGFLVCSLTSLIYLSYYSSNSGIAVLDAKVLLFSLIAGFIGSFSELCSSIVDDNLSIPIVSGLGLTVLNKFLIVF